MLDRRLFVGNVDILLEAHRSRLRELCGKPIEAIWVAWDEEQDTWFPDEAVIVRVGSDNLEIVCWKLDEIALTWNMIDVSARPAWVAHWDEATALSWHRDAIPALRNLVGKTITGVSIIEYLHQTVVLHDQRQSDNVGTRHAVWLLHGVEFNLGEQRLLVFNALDENGVTTEPPIGAEFRRTPV